MISIDNTVSAILAQLVQHPDHLDLQALSDTLEVPRTSLEFNLAFDRARKKLVRLRPTPIVFKRVRAADKTSTGILRIADHVDRLRKMDRAVHKAHNRLVDGYDIAEASLTVATSDAQKKQIYRRAERVHNELAMSKIIEHRRSA